MAKPTAKPTAPTIASLLCDVSTCRGSDTQADERPDLGSHETDPSSDEPDAVAHESHKRCADYTY
jgi:hypothetical protein